MAMVAESVPFDNRKKITGKIPGDFQALLGGGCDSCLDPDITGIAHCLCEGC